MQNKIRQAIHRNRSVVCCGLDQISGGWLGIKYLIDETKDVVAAYKINPHFYGANRYDIVQDTIDYIQDVTNDNIAIILDAKYGDILHTTEYQKREAFDEYGVDAVTAHNYGGTYELFLGKDTGVFVLTWPSSDVHYHNTNQYWYTTRGNLLLTKLKSHFRNLGIVCGDTSKLIEIRKFFPSNIILVPGLGQQQGGMSHIKDDLDQLEYAPCIVNLSRTIANSDNPKQTIIDINRELGVLDG